MFQTIDDIIRHYQTSLKERLTMRKPWDSVPEGYCSTCDSYTTNYNRHGECSDCGTELVESHEEVQSK